MNDALEQRYQILFDMYGTDRSGTLISTKRRIISHCNERRIELRSDAFLFLLANLDHMIIQPYSGFIPGSEVPGAIMGVDDVNSAVTKALDIIFERLRDQEPHSAHAVMLSIQDSWSQLSEVFLWG